LYSLAVSVIQKQERKTKMSEHKRTPAQKERIALYQGDRTGLQSSHIISAKERDHFDLANRDDSVSNYRMQTAPTNQSKHTRIDNYLLGQSPNHQMTYTPIPASEKHGTIYQEQISQRIQQKIDVAKESSDIYNSRYQGFLYKAAAAHNVDLRQFNGYN